MQFTAPDHPQKIANRELGTIEKIDDAGNLQLHLDSGREVAFNIRENPHLDYGYAVTSHSSQGQTADRVLVHADLGLHNLAIDPTTNDVRGVFDYDSAAWADRHHDARYLVLAIPGEPVLEAALAVYEPALARTLDRNRIWFYNAVCAASFLASRLGVPAGQKWCGRTLAEDVRWVRHALDHVRI